MNLRPPLTLHAWLRYDVVTRVLDRLDDVESVLEIGAGEGALGARLAERYEYIGLEPDRRSFSKAQERVTHVGGRVLNGSLESLPPDASFDLVCAFEVLEHIEKDGEALSQWYARVRPGGWMLISVPALHARFGASDRRVGHWRRYDPEQLGRLLDDSGFAEPRMWIYGYPLGNALHATWNLLARRSSPTSIADRTAESGRWLQPPPALGIATWVLAAPFRLLQRPFLHSRLGTGLVAVARRPEQESA